MLAPSLLVGRGEWTLLWSAKLRPCRLTRFVNKPTYAADPADGKSCSVASRVQGRGMIRTQPHRRGHPRLPGPGGVGRQVLARGRPGQGAVDADYSAVDGISVARASAAGSAAEARTSIWGCQVADQVRPRGPYYCR